MSIAISGSTITFADLSTQSTAASASGFKNRIFNGDMRIDQRNAGAAVTPSATTYLVDRFEYSGSQASKFTWQQNKDSVTPPVGFVNYLGGSGTANAKTITLSFRVYSSLTGTFGGSLTNSSNDRTYPFTYSIPTANTWTTVSITIAGDTSGTWLTTNGSGIGVQFGLGAGATYSGTAGAWAGVQYISATGAVSVVGTVGATFFITGVQLEAGSSATEFERRPIGTELALCQRYFWKTVQPVQLDGYNVGGPSAYQYICNPTTMRATPAVSSTFSSLLSATGGVTNIGVHGFQAAVTPTAGGVFRGTYNAGNTINIEL